MTKTDFTFSKKVPGAVTAEEARSMFERTAAGFGSVSTDKRRRAVMRPKASIYKMTVATTTEAGRSESTVISFAGKLGLPIGQALMWIPVVLALTVTVIGLVAVIILFKRGQRNAATAFEEASAKTIEILT